MYECSGNVKFVSLRIQHTEHCANELLTEKALFAVMKVVPGGNRRKVYTLA